MNLQDIQNKKIAILGFGVEGQAIGEYLQQNGVAFDILDRKNDHDYLSKLTNYQIVFRSPGLPVLLPEIVEAQKHGVAFTSQIKYFFDNCQAKIIGVTGTKGKGTTSQLIYDILSAQFLNKVYLGGNIGQGVLQLLGKLKSDDWVILELSSFQLQDLQVSPHIAVVLMTTSEHLDYHADIAEYVQAKANITRHQLPDDIAIINCDYENSMVIGQYGHAQKFYVHTFSRNGGNRNEYLDKTKSEKIKQGISASEQTGEIYLVKNGQNKKIANTNDFQLAGFHNIQNICAALQTSLLAGADLQLALKIAKDFAGLEHRLEFVAEINSIKFYNDSIGTTPESVLAAAHAFKNPEVLIVGGYDKKGDYKTLAREIAKIQNIKAVILIGNIDSQLQEHFQHLQNIGELNSAKMQILIGAKNMIEVFEQVRSCATSGDVVILAPGTSSFDWYKNYKERGNEFKKLALQF